MQISLQHPLLAVILTAVSAAVGVGQAQAGPPGSMGHGEAVVISLQTSPFIKAEPACVGVQIGINLLLADVNGDAPGGKVTPAARVTLFPTLDGVDAVHSSMVINTEEMCTTPTGPDTLFNVISQFVDLGGKILVCPLCWNSRYLGEMPIFGAEIGNAVSVHNLFLTADKVIDF
jgi:hypothetical protein